ncbi:peptidase S74, partial [Streptococcus pneumoniae]|uniref:coiled-coil domain-containing protein n=1 Tax=Streptococcus pneumoniae TaxID=1313 RepID=UPI0034DE99C4|nr:peptidase S74 [Streptococcus pneumoniae]
MDALTRRQFDRAMFAKERTLAIRVGDYTSRDIKEASFEYGYIKGDTYKPGGTCAGSGKITFTSIITTFNKLDTLHPEIGLLVGDTYQWVKMGEYFINDIEIDRNRNTTTLELMDGMFKLNREYVTDLHFPAEVREVIQEICLKTGIELANDYFGISAMRYHIEQVPEGKKLSFRDMLSAMTQMIGMSCFFNREGKMEIRDLTESNITINADSYFLHGLTKSEIEYQISGITCKTDKKSLTVGMKTGRSLELDNVFMTQSALNDLYYKLKNLTYYPYNLNYQGHLLLEVGQWVTIQTNKKETFKVPVLSQSFTFKGGLRGRISADSKAGNDTQYSYEGTITKQIKQQDGVEAKIQAQIEAADKDFDQKVDKIKKDFNDQVELAKARAEEVKRELSDTINQRFNSFDNGPLKETKRKAEEALRNAGASTLFAQEAKRIGLDSVARLEAFKSQTTSAQTALSGDLDALKRTIANDIRPKQAQAEAEIAKQVEALSRTKNELAGVKSSQATYEETTTRRLSELTNLANGKASKSELTQTAEELASRIASVQASGRNLFLNSLFKQDISKTGIWTTSTYTAAIDSESKYLGHKALKIIGLNPSGRDGGNPKVTYPALGQFGKVIPGSTTNQDVTISFYAKANKNGIMLRSRLGNIGYKTGNVTLSTEIKRYVVHIPKGWTNESKQTTNEWLFNFNQEGTIWIWMPKFEISDVDTSYSEAPEDIEGQISTVESTFKQRANSLEAGVSRLTEGLRTKADISTLNVTAENIRQSVRSLETDTQNKLNQKLSQAEFEVRAGSIRQEILNATKDKADKTLVVAEAGKLREEFSKMKVGGRNLWIKSKMVGAVIEKLPENHVTGQKECYRLENNSTLTFNIEPDFSSRLYQKVTFSAWIKYENVVQGRNFWNVFNCFKHYLFRKNSETGVQSGPDYATLGMYKGSADWKYITFTYDYSEKTNFDQLKTSLRFNLEGATSGTAWVTGIKVEIGSVATDWSPAPEDADGLITEAKATFERTAQGLRTDLSAIQEYVNKDGQRQEALQRYTREESARQATAVRELVNRDFVGKATYQEDVKGINQRIEAVKTSANKD